MKENCKKDEHTFIEIMSNHSWDDSEQVVKWCKYCGFVKVDLVYDNRSQTLRSMKPSEN